MRMSHLALSLGFAAAWPLVGCGRATSTQDTALEGTAIALSVKETTSGNVSSGLCLTVNVALAESSSSPPVLIAAPEDVTVTVAASGPSAAQPAVIYSDSACKTAGATVTVAKGSMGSSLYILSPAAGSVALTASATGYGNGTPFDLNFVAGSLQLALNTAMVSNAGVLGNQCQGVLLSGMNVTGTTPVTLTLKGDPGASFFTSYTNLECQGAATTPLTTTYSYDPTVSAGGVYFKTSASATSVQIEATAAGLTVPTLTVPVIPTLLAIDPNSFIGATWNVGDCAALQVGTIIKVGQSAIPDGLVTVTLTQQGGTGFNFYSDKNCTTKATTVTIDGVTGGGTWEHDVYILDTVHGDKVTIGGTATGYTAAKSDQITFN